jgi:hypothetical protein
VYAVKLLLNRRRSPQDAAAALEHPEHIAVAYSGEDPYAAQQYMPEVGLFGLIVVAGCAGVLAVLVCWWLVAGGCTAHSFFFWDTRGGGLRPAGHTQLWDKLDLSCACMSWRDGVHLPAAAAMLPNLELLVVVGSARATELFLHAAIMLHFK